MDQKNFNEIINFAIGEEEKAVKFYRELQDMVEFKGKKELLKELEEMEKGHIKILQNIGLEEAVKADLPKVESMAIADYVVEVKPSSDMNYQDILIVAMKREEKARQLYQDLADQLGDGKIKNLFLRLVNEEAKHKLHFEKIYEDDILKEN